MDDKQIHDFIERWRMSGAAERANYQLFLSELCDVIDVPGPNPTTPDNTDNVYVFERSITFQDGAGKTTTNYIDLYKRGCFVLEAKQGSDKPTPAAKPLSETEKQYQAALKKGTVLRGTEAWDDAMLRARGQADRYIRRLPVSEGRPPFLIVVDVGHSIELFSEFSCTGGTYIPFPSPVTHRIFIEDLEKSDIRERLRAVWAEPHSLDPSRRSARVTRDIAERLARLAVSLESGGHAPQTVAAFLMRCLFTMFAEDVWLLPRGAFARLLESLRDTPEYFADMVEELWQKMNDGGFSTSLRQPILRFNGGLFADNTALPLNHDQLLLLIEAAQCDWQDVEPAIFGTLLERALDPVERHKLGAHYTPRSYVERLVLPTVIEPLRNEWEAVNLAAVKLANQGDIKKAIAEVRAFHNRLCDVRILDPACGSGNFLYVTLEHLKRIEAEAFDTLNSLGDRQGVFEMLGHAVDPHQLLGIEVNPRAAAITELVLWIGVLQWHYRNHRSIKPPEPIIRDFHNIECRDAVLTWESTEPLLDDDGYPVTRWDGCTTKQHPATGLDIPDETARVPVLRYTNPRKAVWPRADFVVGNPPFIGTARMREALGDGYAEALRKTHSDIGPSSDFVMYWWNHAAELARRGKLRRFGFVTTNSLRQKFNRRVLEHHLGADDPLSLLFAIPDHPWVDSADGADVRIAMTVGTKGNLPGVINTVTAEESGHGDGYDVELAASTGVIHPDLTIGADVASAPPLTSNQGVSCPGVKLHGAGFIVTPEEAASLGLGRITGLEKHIRPYRNGRDITSTPRGAMVIDLYGLTAEQVRQRFPEVYQWVAERVKPERDQNKRKAYREKWWVFGEPRGDFRPALDGLRRYIATVETSKHRFFVFLDESVLPDNMLVNIATDDAFLLGVLSSRVHVTWALAAGGRLGVGNDPRYNKTRCFGAFPFPDATEAHRARIRRIAEQLDAHRKRQQELHPKVTLTEMYNVLEKLRAGDELTEKDKRVHEQGLVAVLRELHDELDHAVFAAYGWSPALTDDELLERLVALNAERVSEEERGHIRWLRPEYQAPDATPTQGELAIDVATPSAETATASGRSPWPKRVPDQIQGIRAVFDVLSAPASVEDIARHFTRAPRAAVQDLLDTLVSLGQIQPLSDGRYER